IPGDGRGGPPRTATPVEVAESEGMPRYMGVVVASICFLAHPAWAGPPGENRKVHFLLVGDTDDQRIGNGVRKNLEVFGRLYASLDMEDGDRRGEFILLDGGKANARGALEAASGLEVGDQDDAVVCYVACHGAYDEERGGVDAANGHFLALPGGDLMR